MSYARGTKTESSTTQAEIQTTLRRFGADGFMSGQQRRPDGKEIAMVAFQFQGKMIRFVMDLPDRNSPAFQSSPTGRVAYTEAKSREAWEQACKERWRCLLLAIKAKLVAVEQHIASVEQEFMAWIVMPNGMTAGENFLPRIEAASRSGEMPKLTWEGGAH